ncbi:MAG: TetR/AcrR family transcriptional regulator [Rubrobacteraceae bacterium]
MVRKYEQKKRAENQEETRRRITEATVELHELVGPAHTTISAIAEKAGVQRLTVYRHFPDERALFSACTGHFLQMNPPPDPGSWADVSDPELRLRRGLGEVYAYYRRVEPMLSASIRDAPLKPVLVEVLAPFFEHWERMRGVLAVGWGVGGGRRELLHAAIGHALDFVAWRSLVRQQGLTDEQAVELMVCMVRCGKGSP